MTDAVRHRTEATALRALARSGLPVPELVEVTSDSLLMTLMPGERLDASDDDARLGRLGSSMDLLRRLHTLALPAALPPAPDDAAIIRRYRDRGGPPLPLVVPEPERPVFCHGDWTDGNVLAVGDRITAVVDWEAAHLGDPLRELSRAAWAAARKDPRALDVLVTAYGAEPDRVRQWLPVHAAELWLWFAEAGPPAYLGRLTAELTDWPHA